ncbi:MAG TPA: protein kinase [Pseudonocardia sp.]|nr:protein kinase [Pseudonocardia sp.]
MTDLASETAQSSGPAVADATPAVLEGRYALGELVGVGASAWVYRAEDLRTGRDVAVKLYPPGVGGTDRARQRSELALLAQLHHPNLVVLFDAGEESGRAYLVMEFVDGATLAEQLREGPMQAGEVSRLGAELGYALAYVHSRGITHRDVKPANVLMGGRPMLTDFGIARLVDAARVTQTGYLIGTPAYLAPEQVSGGPVGMPADVYALGLVLLEALTGRREFDGDGPEAAFARLSREPYVPEGLPGLTDLLREMTALDPADRPTAGQVSERLRDSASGLDEVPVMLPLLSGSDEPLVADLPSGPGGASWRDQAFSDTDRPFSDTDRPSGDTGRRSASPARPTGDSGTKVLPMPPAPVVPEQRALRSMPLPPGPALAAGRQRRQRRLLAGALGLTGLAALVIGMFTAHGTPAPNTVPVANAPVATAPAVPPMVAPVQPVPPASSNSGGSNSDSGDWNSGDSSSQQASQDSKKAKQEAKKAKEAQKKAQEKSSSSSDSSGDNSNN